MDLKLVRDVCAADCTLGQLYVDEQFECIVLMDLMLTHFL